MFQNEYLLESTTASATAINNNRNGTAATVIEMNRKSTALIRKNGTAATVIVMNRKPTALTRRNDTAATVIEMNRKSTALTRSQLTIPELVIGPIPERGIGPIIDPNDNDVLCGGLRGMYKDHPGNVQLKDITNSKKKEYKSPTIVNMIRTMNPPGRFLSEDRDTGMWFDIGDRKAKAKVYRQLHPVVYSYIVRSDEGEEFVNNLKGVHVQGWRKPQKYNGSSYCTTRYSIRTTRHY